MSKVFITDGRAPAALAIARSLGRRGIEVHCGESFKYNLSSFSKYVTDWVQYPSPDTDPKAFIERLTEIVQSNDYEMVFPVRDAATLLVAEYQEQLSEWTNLYIAPHETIATLNDKGETIKLARGAGIPVPKTYFPEKTPLDRIKYETDYPVLIRARRSSGSRGIAHVESRTEFDAAYARVEEEYGTPMIQEYIDKAGYSTACILLNEDQEEVASFSYERHKEYPLSGGPTVVGVSTDDEEAKSHARNLLQEANWKGAAEVEFILDETGSPRLLEVNPRFWTPVQLAISSGVDFPYLIWKLSHKYNIDPIQKYETGIIYRWVLPNELLWLLDTPDKWRGLRDFLDVETSKTCYSILSIHDPLPVAGVIMQGFDFLLDAEKRAFIFDRGW